MKSIVGYAIAICICLGWQSAMCQEALPSKLLGWPELGLSEIIDSGLQHNPGLKAGSIVVAQQEDLILSAVNLPNPQVLVQNTTGNFFTVGIQQNLEFPTVYAAQKRLQRENVFLAELALAADVQDLEYQLHIFYAELQYSYQVLHLWQSQDSLLGKIAAIAERQFQAGEIDFVQSAYAKAQAGQVKVGLMQAEGAFLGMLKRIQQLTGITENFVPRFTGDAEAAWVVTGADTSVRLNPQLSHLQQSVLISQRKWNLEKQKVLPALSVGIINNGERETTFPNRIYGGIEIPLWFWQYKGSIASAKKEIEIGRYRKDAQELELRAALAEALAANETLSRSVLEYAQNVIPNTTELVGAANRLFQAGENSFTDYLRVLNDAAEIQKSHLEALKNYHQNCIYILYLCGTL